MTHEIAIPAERAGTVATARPQRPHRRLATFTDEENRKAMHPFNETQILAHFERLLRDPDRWRVIRAIPIHRMGHSHLEREDRWPHLGDLLGSPPTSVRKQAAHPQTDRTIPAVLRESDWDARACRPDLTIECGGDARTAYVLVEGNGPDGSFHEGKGPVQYARGLCHPPPVGYEGATLGVLAVGPGSLFEKPHIRNACQRFQIEFERLHRMVGFRWGIVRFDDFLHVSASGTDPGADASQLVA